MMFQGRKHKFYRCAGCMQPAHTKTSAMCGLCAALHISRTHQAVGCAAWCAGRTQAAHSHFSPHVSRISASSGLISSSFFRLFFLQIFLMFPLSLPPHLAIPSIILVLITFEFLISSIYRFSSSFHQHVLFL